MKISEEINELIKEAKSLKDKEDYEKSLGILEELHKENPNSSDTKKLLMDTLFAYGGYLNDFYTLKYEKAREMFERILILDPDSYRVHYNLGLALFNLGDMKKAKKSLTRALKIKPDYKYCFYNLGLIYEETGKYKKALNYYEKALKVDPKFIYALTARSQVREKLNKLNQKNSK